MKPRALALAFAFALSGSGFASGIPESFDAVNYKKLSPDLAVSGKPSKEALAKLKESGFRTAIDLRLPAEGIADARAAIEAQGLTFVSVPVTPETLTKADAEKVAKVLADPKASPVLLYCASSNRVGGLLAVVEAMKGKPKDEALAEGRKAGLKSAAMTEAAERVMAAK